MGVKLTYDRITQIQKAGCGLNFHQAYFLGIIQKTYSELKNGWKNKIMGAIVSDKDFEILIKLRDIEKPKRHSLVGNKRAELFANEDFFLNDYFFDKIK